MRARLEDTLGSDETATLWSMLEQRDELATKTDLASVRSDLTGQMGSLRTELRSEMESLRTELRGEMGSLRTELKDEMGSLRTELRAEMAGLRSDMSKYARTFIIAQATTVVGVAGIVVGILRFQ